MAFYKGSSYKHSGHLLSVTFISCYPSRDHDDTTYYTLTDPATTYMVHRLREMEDSGARGVLEKSHPTNTQISILKARSTCEIKEGCAYVCVCVCTVLFVFLSPPPG